MLLHGLAACLVLSITTVFSNSIIEVDNDGSVVDFSSSESFNSSSSHRNLSINSDNGLHGVFNLSVYVSRVGNNTPDCIYGGPEGPCLTIQYAYRQTMISITNVTHHVKLIFMDEVYNLQGDFVIDREAEFLKSIELTSVLQTNITAIDEEAGFWVGCNYSYNDPCISYNVEFHNLGFTGFGSDFAAVIVIFNIKLLFVHDCMFSNNNRSAINALDTSIALENIDFTNNKGSLNFKDHGGNLTGFPISNASNGGALAFIFGEVLNKSVTVSNCRFSRNKAAMNLLSPYVGHSLGDHMFPRVGGSVLILFNGNCSDVRVTFVGSNFTRNSAFSGGAVAALSVKNLQSNKVQFIKCMFSHNSATRVAGAILFASWDCTARSALTIIDCNFSHNWARYAGAIQYTFSDYKSGSDIGSGNPGLEIIRSHFCSNIAQTSLELHTSQKHTCLSRLDAIQVNIVDSQFCHHDAIGHSIDAGDPSRYSGVILTKNIDIKFSGSNLIEKNKGGSGVFASNADIHVNGTLNVSQNVATALGGGMALVYSSHLILYPGSHLRFVENRAGTRGGAIAVIVFGTTHMSYIFNPYCFLQYFVPKQPYSKWNTTVEFIDNSARTTGGAIFISTMTACLWNENPPHTSFEKAFKWNDKFVYKNNSVDNTLADYGNFSHCDSDIATDTNQLILQSPKQEALAPGEKMSFKLLALDELKCPTSSVITAYLQSHLRNGTQVQSNLELSNNYFAVDPYEKELPHLAYKVSSAHYKTITSKSVQNTVTLFDLGSPFLVQANLNMTPVYCRPGYVYNGKSSCECQLGTNNILRCDGTKITMSNGLWGTSIKGKLATYECPPDYCKCTQYSNAGKCIYDSLDTNSQCSENREGVLCGACKGRNNNVGYGLSLYTGECIECDSHSRNIAKGGLGCLTFGVMVLALLVVYLNPSFSTKMRGPAFYVQVLPYSYSGRSFMANIVRYAAAVLTLGGSSRLPIPGCLGQDWSILHINALTYIFAAVILLVLLAIYIMSRCLVLRFNRDSPFESFWILLIATYCFFSETSILFFYCVDVNGKRVFFYDGTVECFVGGHLFMVIISSVILVLFVIFPPLVITLICMGRTNAPLQVVDVLSKGLRYNFRWWWAYDLLRRFAYCAVFVFVSQDGSKGVVFLCLSNIFLAVHAYCQPYKDTFANASETVLLFSMSTITALQLSSVKGASEDIAATIIALNYAYIIILFMYLLLRFLERRYNRKFGFSFHQFDSQRIPIPQRSTTPGRLEDS